jgi:hypothetical protein
VNLDELKEKLIAEIETFINNQKVIENPQITITLNIDTAEEEVLRIAELVNDFLEKTNKEKLLEVSYKV